MGLLLSMVVHPASMQDQDGACFVLARMRGRFKRLKVVFADSAYGRSGLPDWTQ
ncbi:hypothetical protein Mal64_06690 [Pseudobythopirellula maris]|uniref:Transposase IS4-like domain-containing protein n=1 Tax=Pseudobythopirellula maris TaxID=2527991 RepID=A0A5C5ZRZ3_9BACT|nr:hypothetical protein Mal64_06690 [Pseudobythopirellula maris]